MRPFRRICLLCVLPAILLAGEPVLIKTPAEANSSPYDNLRIGVPVFTDYVVNREWFCIGFSRKHRQPLWVQYRLLATEVENQVVERSNNFHKAPSFQSLPLTKTTQRPDMTGGTWLRRAICDGRQRPCRTVS